MKALIVDDHALVREGLKQVLRHIDPETDIAEARSAAEAGTVMDDGRELDLVLVDLTLPDRSGFEILSRLRHERRPAMAVVLSASTDSRDIQQAFDGGAVGYIPKGSSAGVTLGALRLILAGGVYVPPEVVETQGSLVEMRSQTPSAPATSPAELGLSERQTQVLGLLVKGMTNKAIARQLNLAEQTVKAHMSAALRALNVTNRTQAVIAVSQLGLDLGFQDRPASRPR